MVDQGVVPLPSHSILFVLVLFAMDYFLFFKTKIVHPFQKGKKFEEGKKKTNVHPFEKRETKKKTKNYMCPWLSKTRRVGVAFF
jgi:hypothetical protein